ncbi:Hypothetical protein FKW44_016483 [Caligus rogercresseyi]|uniref:Uncharacterized protein n=1 Tax=Caligus rogercresseyi TaxID=217165 RepID=A0A7T8H260_CALRO|nr:Hypothetical protein FKW44_016483 [Caligus rogercresseyi]
MDVLDKITCWNMTILPKINHILRCTPFNSASAQAWRKRDRIRGDSQIFRSQQTLRP